MNETRSVSSTDAIALKEASSAPTSDLKDQYRQPASNRPTSSDKSHVVVVGSGVGALSAALKCRAAGHSVGVYERAPHLGGKLGTVHIKGRTFDTGPTCFTLKPVFDDLFESIGLQFDEYVKTEKLAELSHHIWPDNSQLTLHKDIARNARAIEALSSASNAAAYRSFAASSARVFNAVDERFLRHAAPSLINMIRGFNFTDLLTGTPMQTLWAKLNSLFDDERLVQLFARYAVYGGSSPFLAPATMMVLAHTEQRGLWAVRGGMVALVKALVKAGTDKGITYHTGLAVETINTNADHVVDVLLSNGSIIPADAVIFGGDVCALTSGQLGGPIRAAAPQTLIDNRSLSAITMHMTATVTGGKAGFHTMIYGTDYEDEFNAIFERSSLAAEPGILLCLPDRGPFPETSPAGDERVSLIINAPANGDRHTYPEQERKLLLDSLLNRLKQHQINITPTSEPVITTPAEFSKLYPATGGALYGRTTHAPRAALKRPAVRSPIKGLYLAGGSTHPGSGVGLASLSGQMAARCLIEDLVSSSR